MEWQIFLYIFTKTFEFDNLSKINCTFTRFINSKKGIRRICLIGIIPILAFSLYLTIIVLR